MLVAGARYHGSWIMYPVVSTQRALEMQALVLRSVRITSWPHFRGAPPDENASRSPHYFGAFPEYLRQQVRAYGDRNTRPEFRRCYARLIPDEASIQALNRRKDTERNRISRPL